MNPAPATNAARADWLVAPILPVVVVEDIDSARFIAEGFLEGGLNQIELTLRSPIALEAMAAICREFPTLKMAAGTILRPEQVTQAQSAGATLLVSPGYTDALATATARAGIPWVPGVATASEVMRATDAGLSLLKFFPAMAAGGPPALSGIASAIRAARGGDLSFIPTGGVTPQNVTLWKAVPGVVAAGGTWLTRDTVVKARDRATLVQTVRAALAAWHDAA